MPKFCQHFKHLETRIINLVQTFLDDQIANEILNPTGFVSDPDRLAAFRLLAHAEFEEFIEKKAREGLANLTAHAQSNNFKLEHMNQLLAIAHYLRHDIGLFEPFDANRYIANSNQLIKKVEEEISNNNGIKMNSFIKLSLFCGKMPDDVDQTLLSALDSYGSKRGDVAHRSVSRIRTISAPTDEKSYATTIVQLLGSFYDVHS